MPTKGSDGAPLANVAWNEYWRLTREAAAHKSGGPQEEVLARFWTSFFADALAQKSAPRVLDLACGNGAVAAFALRAGEPCRGRSWTVVGIDTSLAAISDLQTRFPSVLAVASDAKHTPFADGSFDLVTSQFGLEYAGIEAFGEAARLVAQGGTLAAIVHLKAGAIYRECATNLQAMLAVQSSGILAAVRDAVRFAAASGPRRRGNPDRRPEDARFVKAAREVEKLLRRQGDGVAGGVVRELHADAVRLYQRRGAYDPADVAQWVHRMANEVHAYSGRMSSMLAAAIDERKLDRAITQVAQLGLSVRVRGKLEMGVAKPEPAAWVLVCDRG